MARGVANQMNVEALNASAHASLAAAGRLGSFALAAAAQGRTARDHLAALLCLAPPPGSQDREELLWLLAATALELLQRQLGEPAGASAEAVLSRLLLPALATAAAREASSTPQPLTGENRQHELVVAAAEVVATHGCWDAGLAWVRSAAGGPCPPEAAGAGAATADLPPALRMQLGAAVIQQVLSPGEAAGGEARHTSPGPATVVRHAVRHCLPELLGFLATLRPESRRQQDPAAAASRVATQTLLPAVLAAAAALGEEAAAVRQLRDACVAMLEGSGRQAALALLVQLPHQLLAATVGPLAPAGSPPKEGRAVPLLRGCLCDDDATTRKRAAFVLGAVVEKRQGADGELAPAWASYFKLLGCLSEPMPHLVQDGWCEIDRLSPAAGSSAADAPLPWPWVEVLWWRGLQHEHPQVRRMALESFLERQWCTAGGGQRLAAVPAAFVVGLLLPTAGDAAMWRGQDAAAMQHRLAGWVGCYAAALPQREAQQALMLGLLGLLGSNNSCQRSKQQPVPPALAQTTVAALAACAEATAASWSPNCDAAQLKWQLNFLHQLEHTAAGLLGSSAGGVPGGRRHAPDVASQLLRAAQAAAPLEHAGQELLAAAVQFLHQLPLPMLLPGAPLHLPAAGWLQGAEQAQLLAAVDSWDSLAPGPLARLALLLPPTSGAKPFSLAQPFSGWAEVLCVLHRRPYLPRDSAERCLLLLKELLAICAALEAGPVAAHPEGQPPLVAWLSETLCSGGAADEMAAFARLESEGALWAPRDSSAAAGDSKLAQLALGCVCGSLRQLLPRALQPSADGAAHAAVGTLAACCLDVLRGFGMTRVGDAAPAGAARSATDWRRAAARCEAVTDSCQALGEALESQVQLQLQLRPLNLVSSSCAALDAALALQTAAAAAATDEAAGKDATAAHCHRLCWKAMAQLAALQGQLGSAQLQHDQQQVEQQGQEERQARLLAAALHGLESADTAGRAPDPRCQASQLHCCRLLLPVALERPRVLQLALACRQQSDGEGAAALVAWLCGATGSALALGARRLRAGLTAALVSTCLHPALFDAAADPSRLDLHAPSGPLQQLVQRMLAVGSKSCRFTAVVSLQLCGLLSRHAQLAGRYDAAVQRLLLWGSSELGVNVPGAAGEPADGKAAAELVAMLAPGDQELAEAFASTSLAPRVAALCMLRSWVLQAQEGGPAGEAARDAALHVWRQLLELSANDPELSAERCSEMGPVHRKKVRLWQALCVLSPLATGEGAEQDFEAVLCALCRADMANVKQYQDAVLLVLLRRRPDLLRRRVLPMLRDCRSSASLALCSLILVAARAAVAELAPGCTRQPAGGGQRLAGDGRQAPLLSELAACLTPWALSHVHAVRAFAQLVLWRLHELFPALADSDPTAAALLRFFRENEDVGRMRRGLHQAAHFDAFDLAQAVTPAGILSRGTSVHHVDAGCEGAPICLLEEVQRFLAAERQQLRQGMRQGKAAVAGAELAPPSTAGQPQPQAEPPTSSNWQRKGPAAGATSAWAAALGTSALLGGGGRRDAFEPGLVAADGGGAANGPRQQLLVVASLVSRAPNLAGLARTCEVFGASGLVVADRAVTGSQEFKSVAVSAHLWLPLVEVPEAALGAWLQRQAAAGWTLVGLEQSSESVPLQAFRFPPKTALVLGREREGLPADLLGLMHATLEIPQLGVIRSLNVHVSGALAVFEYTRQHALAAAGTGGAGSV